MPLRIVTKPCSLCLAGPFLGSFATFGHKIRWCFAVAHVPQSHGLCDWRVCWPQDVANMRNNLKSLSFSRVSQVALGPFFRVPLLRFWHENRWCFAVAHVPQSHALCYWRVCWPQDLANMRNKLKSLSFSRFSQVALGPFFRAPLLRFGHEIRWCFAVAHVPQSHGLCDWQVCWPQDVTNMRNKLKSLSLSRVSQVTLGPFSGFLLLRFGHEIRFCFAVAHVPQSHALCDWRVCWPQDVENMRNKLKSLSFCRISEVTFSPF